MKLEVINLTKTFQEKQVLHNISFSVESGRALGLLGKNGAGKTTTIRILMDVFKPNSGEILIDGKKFNPKDYKIGYLPEERGLYPKTKVFEQVAYFAKLRGLSNKKAKENTEKWLEKLDVSKYSNQNLDTLSKGNQQKVQIAQTLVCEPDIVILDEPFSGLDPVNSQILKDTVKELISNKKLVIFSSHQMSYVEEFCEDIVIIKDGSVVLSGNLKDIKKEFGENKLILSSTNYSPNEINNYFEKNMSEFCKVESIKKDFIVMSLKENISKNNFLDRIIKSDIDIEKFSLYEPTLTDIFIKKVGDN